MLFLENPQIMLNTDSLIIRAGEVDKIINYENIVDYKVIAEEKFQVLVLNIANRDEWKIVLPEAESLCLQILEQLTEKIGG